MLLLTQRPLRRWCTKANRRHPKHEGGLIITRYLRKRGLLKDDNQPKSLTNITQNSQKGP
jgi:hypothetical protein